MRARFVHSAFVRWPAAGSLAVGLSLLILWAIRADLLWKDLGAGWALAAINAAAAFAIKPGARRRPLPLHLVRRRRKSVAVGRPGGYHFLLALLEGGLSTPFCGRYDRLFRVSVCGSVGVVCSRDWERGPIMNEAALTTNVVDAGHPVFRSGRRRSSPSSCITSWIPTSGTCSRTSISQAPPPHGARPDGGSVRDYPDPPFRAGLSEKRPVPRGLTNLLEFFIVFVRDQICVAFLGKEDGR